MSDCRSRSHAVPVALRHVQLRPRRPAAVRRRRRDDRAAERRGDDSRPPSDFAVHGSLTRIGPGDSSKWRSRSWQLPSLPACAIEVRSPPDHTGLGVGTQLGLAIAAGLRRFLQLPELSIEALASSVGRGKRSAVGTYGFQHGGLIVDAGKDARAINSASWRGAWRCRPTWRFVLVRPHECAGPGRRARSRSVRQAAAGAGDVTHELVADHE